MTPSFKPLITKHPHNFPLRTTRRAIQFKRVAVSAPVLTLKKALDNYVASGNPAEREDRERVRNLIQNAHATLAPDGTIHIPGNLELLGFDYLTALPTKLDVTGNFSLGFCPKLANLASQLKVAGTLALRNCFCLNTLPDGLSVGSLDLNSCTALQSLGNGLNVRQDLEIRYCPNITSLPDRLHVTNITLNFCDHLHHLPNELHVSEKLAIFDCGIRDLPETLWVGRDLEINGCNHIVNLHTHLHVGRNLRIMWCQRLRMMGDQPTVTGNMNIEDCPNFTSLPNGLRVGNDLTIMRCQNLVRLPNSLHVGGNLSLLNCRSVSSLPAAITTWGARSDGSDRAITLEQTGLSPAILGRLMQVQAPGMRFHFDNQPSPHLNYTTIEDGILSWLVGSNDHQQTALTELNLPTWGLASLDERTLTNFLSRLHNTAEARNPTTLPHLQQRVLRLLKLMRDGQPEYRALVIATMAAHSTNCDDAIMQGMDALDEAIEIQLAHSSDNPQVALYTLGRKFFALHRLKDHVTAKIATLQWVDEIEVLLFYKTHLTARGIELPTATHHMIFVTCAQTTTEDIQIAETAIKADLNDPAKVDAFITHWDPYRLFVEKQNRRNTATTIQYGHLPRASVDQIQMLGQSPICSISQEPLASFRYRVLLNGHLFELDELTQWWIENGTHPITRENLSPDQFHNALVRCHMQ